MDALKKKASHFFDMYFLKCLCKNLLIPAGALKVNSLLFFTREAESEGVNNSPYVELSELEDKVQMMNWQAILLLCFEGSSSLSAS